MTLDLLRTILRAADDLVDVTDRYRACRMSDLEYIGRVKDLSTHLKKAREEEETAILKEVRM